MMTANGQREPTQPIGETAGRRAIGGISAGGRGSWNAFARQGLGVQVPSSPPVNSQVTALWQRFSAFESRPRSA
jgi:hypothetical protein